MFKNFTQMMKQAQEIQEKMAEAQQYMDQIQATGSAGGGMVTVTLNGKFKLISIQLDPAIIQAQEKDILEDLIVAAHHDAMEKIQVLIQEKMQTMTGGLSLPPGFKLPFGS